MELKSYQQEVINDLKDYLNAIDKFGQYDVAFNEFWAQRIGSYDPRHNKGMQPYKNIIPNTPNVCIKVPTAGGKTFIGINALNTIFEHYNASQPKAVVWLAPWNNLLEQTYQNLSNPDHPYRQKLDQLFAHRVAVYRKEEALQGAGLNPASVRQNLTIFVLGYASLRAKKKDERKVYQENGYLMAFKDSLDPAEQLPEYDETSLINIIRGLNPVVIVDESHNAESELSVDMLRTLNPSFVLDLTATPKANSNIISYVPAYRLKQEHMVKLPVTVYNCQSRHEVIVSALNLQKNLELKAEAAKRQGGRYIRPIVLFQAQPANADDSATFDKIKQELLDANVPEAYIKIKTAKLNELQDIDLMSQDCEVRFIITINALKEGWDCPFAYVLATLANKSSSVDVEQILGRVLRQPYVEPHADDELNRSYVLTASNVFIATLQNIVSALQANGFSKNDYRAPAADLLSPPPVDTPIPAQDSLLTPPMPATWQTAMNDALEHDGDNEQDVTVSNSIDYTPIDKQAIATNEGLAAHLAKTQANRHLQQLQTQDLTPHNPQPQVQNSATPMAWSAATSEQANRVQELAQMGVKVNTTDMLSEHRNTALALRLPQFFLRQPTSTPSGLFDDEEDALLSDSDLLADFNLSGESINIDFGQITQEVYQVDISQNQGDTSASYTKISHNALNQRLIDLILASSDDNQINEITNQVMQKIGNMYPISDAQIKTYVARIIQESSESQRRDMLKFTTQYTKKIKDTINALSQKYAKENFIKMVRARQIEARPYWQFSSSLPIKTVCNSSIGKRLYDNEGVMNGLEQEIILQIASLPNVVFWHRNSQARNSGGFVLNGFINHYPDFIVYTASGTVIMLETKGDYGDNSDSEDKIYLGDQWERLAGNDYRYMMVFKTAQMKNAYSVESAIEIIGKL